MILLEAKRTMKDAIAWVYDESGSRQVPPFVEAALKDGVKAIESIIRCKDCKYYTPIPVLNGRGVCNSRDSFITAESENDYFGLGIEWFTVVHRGSNLRKGRMHSWNLRTSST